MKRLLGPLGMLALTLAVAGCSGLARPNWFHPGSAKVQQRRAERFDPYPQEMGAPPVEGARPLAYQRPPVAIAPGNAPTRQQRAFYPGQ